MNYTKFRGRMEDGKVRGTDLARVCQVPQSTMNDWLRRGKPMPADVIRSIALYMDMDPIEIARELLGMDVEEEAVSFEEAVRIWVRALCTEIGASVPQKGN